MNKFKVTMQNGGVFIYESKRISTIYEMLEHLIKRENYTPCAIVAIEKLPDQVYSIDD